MDVVYYLQSASEPVTEDYKIFEEIARLEDRPASSLIRIAMREYIERHRNEPTSNAT